MSISPRFRFLRPCFQRVPKIISASERAAYLQFYSAARKLGNCRLFNDLGKFRLGQSSHTEIEKEGRGNWGALTWNDNLQKADTVSIFEVRRDDTKRRVNELEAACALKYPRIKSDDRAVTCAAFRDRYSFLMPGESSEGGSCTLRGRYYNTSVYERC